MVITDKVDHIITQVQFSATGLKFMKPFVANTFVNSALLKCYTFDI